MIARVLRIPSALCQRLTAWSIIAVGLLPFVGPARGDLLVYEPFDYDANTVLDGIAASAFNLTGSYVPLGSISAQKLVVSEPGLVYGNLLGAPHPTGNRANDVQGVTAAGATVRVDQDVVIPPGSAIFWSALFTFDDSTNGNRLANVTLINERNGDELSFGESAAGIRAIRVSAHTAATGQLIAVGADGAFENGHTLLLVGRYVNSPAVASDIIELVGYDTADADVLPTNFDPSDPQAEFAYRLDGRDIDFEQNTAISFNIRGDSNNFIDELRIGTTYASVALLIPEPNSLVLSVVGALFCLQGRVTSRRNGIKRHSLPNTRVFSSRRTGWLRSSVFTSTLMR